MELKNTHGWLRTTLLTLLALLAMGYATFRYVQHQSDGPLNDLIPGGPLRSGTSSPFPSAWAAELATLNLCAEPGCESMEPLELQLETPARSRYVGMMLHGDNLYIPCDLGFMWGRFDGTQKRVLEAVYYLKTWHKDAAEQPDAVLRLAGPEGRRYAVSLEKVADAKLIAALKRDLEEMAKVWIAPEPLGPPPTSGPSDIWFFKINARLAG